MTEELEQIQDLGWQTAIQASRVLLMGMRTGDDDELSTDQQAALNAFALGQIIAGASQIARMVDDGRGPRQILRELIDELPPDEMFDHYLETIRGQLYTPPGADTAPDPRGPATDPPDTV